MPDNTKKRDKGKQIEHIGYAALSENWVSAESLKYGDRVLLFDGTYGIIQSVKVNRLATSEITYNFEVEDFHTYFVGEQRVLVHNANCFKTPICRHLSFIFIYIVIFQMSMCNISPLI